MIDTQTPPARRAERVRHELRRRALVVQQALRPCPGFIRLVFEGPELEGFSAPGFDDHIKFMHGDTPGPGPAEAPGELHRRDYTPRTFDAQARTLTLDFATHAHTAAHGGASAWAAAARPGDAAWIGGPKGSFIVPTDFDTDWLVADAAAVPALTRRLEALALAADRPAGAACRVALLLPDPADRTWVQAQAAALPVQWSCAATPAELLSLLSAWPAPQGALHAWAAGEAGLMKAVRQHWLAERALPRQGQHLIKVGAYWQQGVADHHERLTD